MAEPVSTTAIPEQRNSWWSNPIKDGSKKRNRYHYGLIAQQVRSVLENNNLDWAGLQDHSLNGGQEVLSIGYTELISPLIKAIQELTVKVNSLESQINK